jgi:hypothetical protein
MRNNTCTANAPADSISSVRHVNRLTGTALGIWTPAAAAARSRSSDNRPRLAANALRVGGVRAAGYKNTTAAVQSSLVPVDGLDDNSLSQRCYLPASHQESVPCFSLIRKSSNEPWGSFYNLACA